ESLEDRSVPSLTAVGGEFGVNTFTSGTQQTFAQPPQAVAADANGNYVVTWSSQDQDGSGWGVYAQRYTAAGVALGGEFRVNTTTAGDQEYSTVAMDPSGNFVITWSSLGGGNTGIYAQRYNAAGAAQGGEFRVDLPNQGSQDLFSTVAMDAAGDFVVT